MLSKLKSRDVTGKVLRYIGKKCKDYMLKVVVFDGGCGGEIVAEFLAAELNIVEIIPVIDAENAPYEEKTLTEVCLYTERALQEYLGKVDLIVLGGYTTSHAKTYLSHKYPRQKFVAMGVNYYRILKSRIYPNDITVMMNNTLIDSEFCAELQRGLPHSTLSVPDCTGWEDMINAGMLTREVMRADLENYFYLAPLRTRQPRIVQQSLLTEIMQKKYIFDNTHYPAEDEEFPLIRSDVVLLLNTNFWAVKEELEYLFGYQVRVLDFRQKLLHDVCTALGLLGVDGERSK